MQVQPRNCPIVTGFTAAAGSQLRFAGTGFGSMDPDCSFR